jgi:GT2 family glycosyltransferase
MKGLTVVSGTYNRLALLQAMVDSARKSAQAVPLRFALCDGGSTDGTLAWCKTQDDITLIEHGELRGAIKAYNDAAARAETEYVVIGNDDVTFAGDTLLRAYRYMEANPEVGIGAFEHRYQRRGPDQKAGIVQNAYGYLYGQCCIVRRWLGDLAGWWGDDGMRTYGGDTRLSLRAWELGWPVVRIQGCAVVDNEHEDELRERNSDTPWAVARAKGEPHPDLVAFARRWLDRLPPREEWIPAPSRRVLRKAMAGNLRSLRFKAMMRDTDQPRTALVDALARFGEAKQVHMLHRVAQTELSMQQFQDQVVGEIEAYQPDLVIFQAQRPNNVMPETIWRVRRNWPWIYLVNWDGDTHYPLTQFHFDVAQAVHLQLVVSPTWFGAYAAQGIGVGYWPIGIEQEYLDQDRAEVLDGPDVLFTGALYGLGKFPEAEFRREAVLALAKSGLDSLILGPGWPQIGLDTKTSIEKHAENAALMARSKMTLSISQASDLWGYTSDRLYNITATGCPALVQRFAGMEQHGYVDGETCIAFETIEEMLDKARYYLDPAHINEREDIGAAGRVMTHSRHTWERRLDGLWCMLEGLP